MMPGGSGHVRQLLAEHPTRLLNRVLKQLPNSPAVWLTAAGFVDVRTLDAPGPSPLVLATKP